MGYDESRWSSVRTLTGRREVLLDGRSRPIAEMTGEGLEPSTNGLTYLIGFHRPPCSVTSCDHKRPLWRIAYGGFAPKLGALRCRGNRASGTRTAIGSRRRGTSGVTSGGSMLSRTRKRWRGFGRPSPPRAGIGCWGLVLAVRSMRTNDLTNNLPRSDAGALPSESVR
jgi:hypothetical protein